MSRYERFTFLLNKDERDLIKNLAKQLDRSQSDAVRFVVIRAAKELQKHDFDELKIAGGKSNGDSK